MNIEKVDVWVLLVRDFQEELYRSIASWHTLLTSLLLGECLFLN